MYMKHINRPESVMIFNSVLVKFKLIYEAQECNTKSHRKAKSRFKLSYF